jgi:hypothetical protein
MADKPDIKIRIATPDDPAFAGVKPIPVEQFLKAECPACGRPGGGALIYGKDGERRYIACPFCKPENFTSG